MRVNALRFRMNAAGNTSVWVDFSLANGKPWQVRK
jgi:hypothetical protein